MDLERKKLMTQRSIDNGIRMYQEGQERAAKKASREMKFRQEREEMIEAQHPFKPVFVNQRSREILDRCVRSTDSGDRAEIRLMKKGFET
jgi:hypothetical protein